MRESVSSMRRAARNWRRRAVGRGETETETRVMLAGFRGGDDGDPEIESDGDGVQGGA